VKVSSEFLIFSNKEVDEFLEVVAGEEMDDKSSDDEKVKAD